MLDQAVKNLRAGQELGIFNQAAQRSQQVLPLELQDASHAGDTLQGIGMGLGTLSTLLSLGGTSALGAAGSVAGSGAQMAARPQNGYGWMNE
jgi:hypothetical protein